MEEMLENYYNLYSSCAYGQRKRRWYVALKKSGRPRRGKKSRKRRKSSHFLVVHFDGTRMAGASGYMMARRNNDGSVEMLGARGGHRDDDHSRFGAASRDAAWRDETGWRKYVQNNHRMPIGGGGVFMEDVIDGVADRPPPTGPPIGIAPVPPLEEILAGSVRKQRLLDKRRPTTALQQQPAIVAENLKEEQERLLQTEQRRRRRRKERRLERDERRREKRKKKLQQLRQQEQG